MDFLKHVLNEIKPTEEEAEKVKEIIGNIKKRLKIKGAVVELGGSGRKKTWLRGSHDIDLYAKFDFKKYKSKDISAILEKIRSLSIPWRTAAKTGNINKLHHTYQCIHTLPFTF